MKIRLISIIAVLLVPSFLFAADSPLSLGSLVDLADTLSTGVVTSLGYLMFALAVVAFLWGMVQFIWNARNGDSGKDMENGKQFMIWGLIGLFVMFSVWGIIKFAQKIFNIQGQTSIVIPNIKVLGSGSSVGTGGVKVSPQKDGTGGVDVSSQNNGTGGANVSSSSKCSSGQSSCTSQDLTGRKTYGTCDKSGSCISTCENNDANGGRYMGYYYEQNGPCTKATVSSSAGAGTNGTKGLLEMCSSVNDCATGLMCGSRSSYPIYNLDASVKRCLKVVGQLCDRADACEPRSDCVGELGNEYKFTCTVLN